MDGYIVIVYHFRGLLLRNDDGVVEYINGRVDELTEVDADYINLKDLESIFKGYGYEKCERIMWLKPGAPDLEHGLQPLCLDSDINAMCAALQLPWLMAIGYIFTLTIVLPCLTSYLQQRRIMGCFLLRRNLIHMKVLKMRHISLPPGVEDLSEEYNKEAEDYEARDDEAQDDEAEDPEEQCRPKKKKPARQSNDDSNEDVNEEETNEEEANDSFDENGYEYDSEELKTPRSSDDEGHDSETLAQFNEKAEFGHVNLELGMEFVSLEQFKNAVKDYNISLGREFIWLKNDKQRARARCSVKECEWLIYCGWNNICHTWQIKTFEDKHTCCRVFKNSRATGDWPLVIRTVMVFFWMLFVIGRV